MRFGLLYEAQRPFEGTTVDWNTLYKETLEQCVLAEKMGFDNIWFVEHHFLTGFSGSPCPEVLLGALSQLTKRIRIGFGVCILPYHHPVRVAERAAMLDQLTDGRLELGTGRSNAYEQIGQGIDPRDTRAMWEESITMIPRIWQSDEFSWEGTFWKVPTRRVLPKPYQKPHPPLYLACTQTDSFDVAADKGIGVLSSATYATTILAEHVKRYRARVRQATPVGAVVNEYWGNNVHAFCGEDNREARELAALLAQDVLRPRQAVHPRPHQRLRRAPGVVGRRARPLEGRFRSMAPAIRRRAPGAGGAGRHLARQRTGRGARGLRPDGSRHAVRARHHPRR